MTLDENLGAKPSVSNDIGALYEPWCRRVALGEGVVERVEALIGEIRDRPAKRFDGSRVSDFGASIMEDACSFIGVVGGEEVGGGWRIENAGEEKSVTIELKPKAGVHVHVLRGDGEKEEDDILDSGVDGDGFGESLFRLQQGWKLGRKTSRLSVYDPRVLLNSVDGEELYGEMVALVAEPQNNLSVMQSGGEFSTPQNCDIGVASRYMFFEGGEEDRARHVLEELRKVVEEEEEEEEGELTWEMALEKKDAVLEVIKGTFVEECLRAVGEVLKQETELRRRLVELQHFPKGGTRSLAQALIRELGVCFGGDGLESSLLEQAQLAHLEARKRASENTWNATIEFFSKDLQAALHQYTTARSYRDVSILITMRKCSAIRSKEVSSPTPLQNNLHFAPIEKHHSDIFSGVVYKIFVVDADVKYAAEIPAYLIKNSEILRAHKSLPKK